MSTKFWKVAVEAPIQNLLTYLQPENLEIDIGKIVKVPLGRRKVLGLVVDRDFTSSDDLKYEIKKIEDIVFSEIIFHQKFIEWLDWVANYYIHPPGEVFSMCLPSLEKRGKSRKKSAIDSADRLYKRHDLTDKQKNIFEKINHLKNEFQVHLIHGITGSGKTEIYLDLFEEICIKKNKSGLFLVPEISLTPQLLARFVSRFSSNVGIFHSQLTDRERTEEWWKFYNGEKKILIGARSALFIPNLKLSLIIIDEEHETSFKQDEKLKYHARDSAIVLAKKLNIPIVLGSATPSLESWNNAITDKYQLHTLSERANQQSLPEISVIDIRRQEKGKSFLTDQTGRIIPDWCSLKLFEKLKLNFERGYQSALFINRRGMSQVTLCEGCGYCEDCPNCDVSLTLHARTHLVCHYCDYHKTFLSECPSCKIGELKNVGIGTELIEADLKGLFPQARVLRVDRDEIQSREAMESFVRAVEDHQVDIIIGTQMIAKGLDFPKLTLVGIVLADLGLNIPDFRASERTLHLLQQVAGRAGRHKNEDQVDSLVIVQTYNPDHIAIQMAAKHNYVGFAMQELQDRKDLSYPPFGKILNIKFQGLSAEKVKETASSAKKILLKLCSSQNPNIEILGPAPAPLSKIKNNYRYHILLKSDNSSNLNKAFRYLMLQKNWVQSGVKVTPDIDPANLL
jgi:primosomal protein N' (replication factor Y)